MSMLLLVAMLLAGCGSAPAEPGVEAAEYRPETAPGDADGTDIFDAGAQAGTLTPDEVLERVRANPGAAYLFAANVGKGDALVLRVGGKVWLVDTGKAKARGRVLRALEAMGAGDGREGVFLTHTDDDHVGGLEWLPDALPVGSWYAPAMYTGVKEGKHPVAKVAGDAVKWLRRGDAIPLEGGATLKVLAPASLFTDKDDNNSLVLMLESDQGRMLLAGDMELPEEAELLSFRDDLNCAVLKVPNHADDDTTSAAFARACAAQIAVISTDGAEKPGTPDPGVVSRLRAAGSQVVTTEDSGLGIFVTLEGGVAAAYSVDFGAPTVEGAYVAEVDPEDDRIVLGNRGDAAFDLGGCYLYSDRGGELFPFPEGASIQPGGKLTVGTNSTDGQFDILWDDKKVVHRKKTDNIYLYDSWGRVVDYGDNGM